MSPPLSKGWYYDKDGSQRLLVGYFNRNTKQEFDIPGGRTIASSRAVRIGASRRISIPGRHWGLFTIKLPKDFGEKKLTWTIVANGFTNTITLHTKADYIVEPFEDAANKNTPPVIKFSRQPGLHGPADWRSRRSYTATVGTPLPLTVWATDEGPKINIPEPRGTRARAWRRGGRARGRGGTRSRRRGVSRRLHRWRSRWSMFARPGQCEVRQSEAVNRQRRQRQGVDHCDVQRSG